MNAGVLLSGLVLLLLATGDLLWTTLWVDGSAGPLTGRVTTSTRRLMHRLTHRTRGRHSLSLGGAITIASTLASWVLFLWAGWSLVFLSDPRAVVNASTGQVAGTVDRIYFAGYTVFTLGNGDFRPGSGAWQILTVVANASGLLLVTLAVTYVLPIISAIVQKRAFASGVAGLGTDPAAILLQAWDGNGFPRLSLRLTEWSTRLSTLAEQHLAYPVLHNFFSRDASKSGALAVAQLDEALLILEHAVDPAYRPAPTALQDARSAVRTFLDTFESAFIRPADVTPELPDLASLRQTGIPLVPEEDYRRAAAQSADRRRLLLAIVQNDRWTWNEHVLGRQSNTGNNPPSDSST